MKKTIILLICLCTSHLFSQHIDKKEKKHAIAIGIGTGASISYSYKLNNYFSATARYGALPYEKKDYEYELDGQNLLIDGKLDFSHIDALISIAPFGKAFRFVLGAGYFTSNNINASMTFTEEVKIGDVVFTPDEVGVISINADWKSILPYLGIAFGRAVPKTGFGFGLELGTFYDSSGPKMSLDATGIIEETKNQQALLQESFKENKFLPYATLRFAYSF